jgi:membrane protein YqaA with SNARE-associated domain
VLTLLLITMGVAFASALMPLVSIEVFVLGLTMRHPEVPWAAIGAVVAVGQLAGKMPYFYAARGTLKLPAFLHRTPKPVDPDKPPGWWTRFKTRWHPTLDRLRDRCHRHPKWMIGTTAVSAFVGIPPFMAITVLAGLAGLSLAWFVGTSVPGRFARYCVLAACPAILSGWMA